MRFRNGVVYRESDRYNCDLIKIVRRNSSRTFGMVKYRIAIRRAGKFLWSRNIYVVRPQKLKQYKPLYGF